MTIPKSAIEKAVIGGWNSSYLPNDEEYWTREHFCVVALDPTFWQALGKVLGWKQEWNGQYMNTRNSQQEPIMVEGWEHNAHRFYDLILTGQSTEKFWEDILK